MIVGPGRSSPIMPLPSPLNESTEAELRRVKAELGSALSRLNRVTADLDTAHTEIAYRSQLILTQQADLEALREQLAAANRRLAIARDPGGG